MRFRRRFTPSSRRRGRFVWVRETVNNATPNATINNIDLLSNWRTHAGIAINFPEITIWRIKIRISVIVSGAAAVAANDGVLATVFVDGMNQAVLNQSTNGYDEADLIYHFKYVTEYAFTTGNMGAQTAIPLWSAHEIKSHRKFRSIDDTCFLQLASTGQSQITGYSYNASILLKVGR